nr:GTPase domain-containing protein [Arthrobacter sp. zg-Y1116]
MGRTMAGKSSLLAALSGAHFDRIGDGRQRFSRDIFVAQPEGFRHIEIVDTPGVGAQDGAEDVELAFEAAREADLILWVASSDSVQEETAHALTGLALMGKPIIVALNCRQSLGGVGRLNLLRFPERVFGQREGLVSELRRHMAKAAVEPLDIIHVHALAATEARAHTGDVDEELETASRIRNLIDSLNREYSARSASRRVLRMVDGQRSQAEILMLSLAQGAETYRSYAAQSGKRNEEVHRRLSRILRLAGEDMASEIAIVVARRHDWHLSLSDFGESVQQVWDEELQALHDELTAMLDSRLSKLMDDVTSSITAADAEWTHVSGEMFGLRDLTGFDSVLGNRLARLGVRGMNVGSAIAGAWAGTKIGALVGIPSGPGAVVPAAIGGLVGLGLGLALEPLKGLGDRWFLGKDGVLRKRREELAKQIGPILDRLESAYSQVAEERLSVVRAHLEAERARGEDQCQSLVYLAEQRITQSKELGALIKDLDKETVSALLRLAGRERLARFLKRATRVPGVCILAEFETSAHSEAWLFPPDIGEKLASGHPPDSGDGAASALPYVLGLTDKPATVLTPESGAATILIEEDVPSGITDTWSDALSSHTGKYIRIEHKRRSSEP